MQNIIDHSINQCEIDFPAITLILRHWRIIQRQSKLSITTTSETELFHGKICSFVTHGQTTLKLNPGLFILFLELKDYLNCDVITS